MRRMMLAAAAAAALGAMPAIGVSPAAAADQPVKITWWHAMSGQLGQSLDDVVAKFNASQAKYRVEAVNKGNYVATLNAAIAAYRAGEPPHLLQNNESGVLTMMLSGAIVPAHDILAKHGIKVEVNAYLRPVIDTYTDREGKLLAMPFNSSTPILYFNKEMLDKAGIAAPPATWQEMEAQIRKVKAAVPGACGYSFPGGSSTAWVEFENFSVYHDIPYATKANGTGGLDAEIVYNKQPLLVGHISRLKRWLDEGLATFGAADKATWASGARNNFLEGKCAFWADSTAWHGTVEQGAKMKWGAGPLPYDAAKKPNRSMIGGAALYSFKGHKPEEYAGIAEFFRFLTSADLQVSFHKATGYVPITVAAWEKAKAEGYYKEKPTREIAVLQLLQGAGTDNARCMRLGNFENVRAAQDEELDKLWAGKVTVQQALDEGVRKANEIVRRFAEQNRGKI